MFTIATWNINSVRLREALVTRLLTEEAPDILCLQEIKTPIDKFPVDGFEALGYRHLVARGQKGYNGVAILSKLPLEDAGERDHADLGMPATLRLGWRMASPSTTSMFRPAATFPTASRMRNSGRSWTS